ncbi:ribonuclease H-like domain-containing protein [Tanacetum coccineum]
MHVVPPPMTGNYMPFGPDVEIDYPQFTYGLKQSQPSESETQTIDFDTLDQPKVWSDAPIIEEYELDSEDEHVSLPTEEQETPSFANKQVNTAEINAVSAVGGKRETAVNPSAGCNWRQKGHYWQNISKYNSGPRLSTQNFTDKGIVDSGCSRHMTGNKAYVAEYQDFNGGPVAFGGCKGYITGKGKIKTGKLDFKDVCIVKELQHFNIFYVSQICDKKKKFLFTDSECLVLSPEFKLLDANQVLLRIPRQNNMYSFNLENIVPSGGKGPNWLFDLDYLTDSMNYQPVRSENQANKHVGLQEANQNAGTEDMFAAVKRSTAKDAGEAPNKHPDLRTDEKPVDKEDQVFFDELERLKRQEQDANDAAEALRKEFAQETEDLLLQAGAAKTSSTNLVNTASTPVSTVSPYVGLSFFDPTNPNQDDSEIPALEDFYKTPTDGIFINSSYDDEGAVVDFTNLETIVNISPIPTSRINPIHPSTLILGDPQSAKAIGTKWVYRNKKDERGVVVRNKARLVAQGHRQEEGIDYDEALMKSRFQMSSMGELNFFLGLQVKQKEEGIFISQDKYVAEILKKFDFVSVKTVSTPIETQKPLVKDEEASDVDVHLYRFMIGSLMYLTASSPDIMYLKGKPKLGLWYPRVSSFDLEAYSDSDYVGANLDRKSTTGGCQFLGRRLISWQCKKHTIVATSTTEAKYIAAANCCGQVLWIQNQMLDYGFNFMNTKIYIDNESTIRIVKNPVYHSKTKHIAIRHHFIRDAYEKKLIPGA